VTRRRIAAGVLLAVLLLGIAGECLAQTRRPSPQASPPRPTPPFRPGSIEVDAGVLWLGSIDFGSPTAAITANGNPPSDYPLFRTASQLSGAPAYEGRIGLRLTRMIGIEGAFQYARLPLETRISGDLENAPGLTASNDLSRYIAEVSGVVHLTRYTLGGNGSPFLLGGAGYVRELDESQALAETGRVYHAGGGVKYLFSERAHGLIKGMGLRADARIYFRQGGFELEEGDPLRRFFGGGASLLVAF
jgi:hypothetical protein